MTPSKADAAAALSVPDPRARDAALRELKEFRVDVRSCLTRWGDALFEIADAVLCGEGPVRNLAELSLVPEHARSHGSIQRAMSNGRVDFERLSWSFALHDLPRGPGGGIVLAVDTTPWLRPDADTSDQRTFCHTYALALAYALALVSGSCQASCQGHLTVPAQVLVVATARPSPSLFMVQPATRICVKGLTTGNGGR